MSTYVMSDIHGCFDDFQMLLRKAGFSGEDQLILAGDMIERGPQNYEMLRWMEECHDEVLLIRGNHEEEFAMNVDLMDQIADSLYIGSADAEGTAHVYDILASKGNGYFDYYGSIKGLIREHAVTIKDLNSWAELIRDMPYKYKLKVGGRTFIIVHAGYIENLKKLPERGAYRDISSFYLYAREEAYLYGGQPHSTVIAGHTPTIIPQYLTYTGGKVFSCYNEKKDCRYYNIDCGAVFRHMGEKSSNMACIRLEDEKITYLYDD